MAINEDSVGKLYTTNGSDAWRCVSYCSQPTATFLNLETGEQCGGGVYSPNVAQYKPLVQEDANG